MALTKLNNQSLVAVTAAGIPVRTGAVLQVVQGSLKTQFAGTGVSGSGYRLDVGLAATITPTATNSSILIHVSTYVGISYAASTGYQQMYYVYKAGSELTSINGTSNNGRPPVAGMVNAYSSGLAAGVYRVVWLGGSHLEPNVGTTSATEYKVFMRGYSSGPVVYVNRSEGFQTSSGDYDACPNSTITLTEISG